MVAVTALSPDDSNDVWVIRTSFTAPTTLYLSSADETFADFKLIKQLKGQYDAEGLEVTQSQAKSKDGTMIPYFMIAKKGLVYGHFVLGPPIRPRLWPIMNLQ